MADCRKPGPTGPPRADQDLSDGTLIRRLSPRPGPTGQEPGCAVTASAIIPGPGSPISSLLAQLEKAGNAFDLKDIAVMLFGGQCFSAGVIVGIGADIINDAVDLVKLVKMLVLADLNDLRTGKIELKLANAIALPRILMAKLAALAFEEEMRQAARERDALIKELMEVLGDPKAFLVGLADSVVEGYQKDWEEFLGHMKARTLEGRFRAGMIFGRLLVVVLGLIVGAGAAAKTAAKLAGKLPKLTRLARSVKPKLGRTKGGGVGGGKGSDGPSTPDKPKSEPSTKPSDDHKPQSDPSGTGEDGAQAPKQTAEEKLDQRRSAQKKANQKKKMDEADAKGMDKPPKVSEADSKWLNSDSRNKELAYDPDTGKYKIDEAKAALKAEETGAMKGPVSRDINHAGTSSNGGDIVDGGGKVWDAKDSRAPASAIQKTIDSGENVMVHGPAGEIDALKKAVKPGEGSGDIIFVPTD